MHSLTTAFVPGYHGCDAGVARKLLDGADFLKSENKYDWLGHGIYFRESDPVRGLDYARELKSLPYGPKINEPAVIGAVLDPGLCLDLTTSSGVERVQDAYQGYKTLVKSASKPPVRNNPDKLRRNLDCAVINDYHKVREKDGLRAVDTVKAVFTEGLSIYETSGFLEKTHIQKCVRNPDCIKGVFRVPDRFLSR